MKILFSLLCLALCAASASAGDLVGTRFEAGAASPKALLERFGASASRMAPVEFSYADALPPVPPDSQEVPPLAEAGFLDSFRAIEAEILAWDQSYRRAPSGSDEEAEARRQLQLAADQGHALAADQDSLQTYLPEVIEELAKDCARKYQQAASGSVVEDFYKEFMAVGWKAFAGSSERGLRLLGHWRGLVDAAAAFDRRYQAAPSGSDEEAAAKKLRDFAWERAPEVLERQLGAVLGSRRGLEAMASEFEAGYQVAPSGSAREAFYNRARTVAYDAAYREAGRTLAEDPRPEVLAPLEAEYDARYKNASSGSPAEDYCKKVRDLIRQYLPPR